MSNGMRILVSGRVQGVFYRASAKQRAEQLGLCGHARNLADGRVEIEAIGSRSDLHMFVQWCRVGPANARVERVETEAFETDRAVTGFEIR